jgi:hypothetical protein
MKATALLAATAALLAASPAMAGGYVGLGYNTAEDSNSDSSNWHGEGAIGGASGQIGYQVDGGVATIDDNGTDSDAYSLAGHLYWNGANWRLGGVVSTSNFEFGPFDFDETFYGVEGTYDLSGSAVLVGSYTVGESEFLVDLDTWNADLGLHYYINENLRLSGSVGFGNLDGGGANDFDTSSFGVGAEWQPWANQISLHARYDRFEVDSAFDEYDLLTVGVRWNFGANLRERDNATPFDARGGLYQRAYGYP